MRADEAQWLVRIQADKTLEDVFNKIKIEAKDGRTILQSRVLSNAEISRLKELGFHISLYSHRWAMKIDYCIRWDL